MAESSSSGDEEFRGEVKYKQFSAAVERALKGFELSSEWHDLISSLARLNKTLLAYKQYPVVPHHLMVSKRLSQCLHPNLPGGVHLKALDVYRAIFDRISAKGLSESLLVYSSGLFPLLGHGAMSVRPSLLDIYERYYLAVGRGLIPCLPGMVLGLLPGLEDESEHTERITRLLDALCVATDESAFYSAVWHCILSSQRSRLPAISYIHSKLNKKATAEDQAHYLGGNLPLMVSGLCAALQDKSVLVCRATLDVILTLFPLHHPFLLSSDTVLVLSSALETLLRRDMSLNRRLFSWLLGTQVDKNYMETHFPEVLRAADQEAAQTLYFDRFSKSSLLSALRSIISSASQATRHAATRSDCVLPYRLLRSLMDKPEIGDAIVADILPNLCTCLKIQVENLGGVPAERSVPAKLNVHSSKSSARDTTGSSGGSKKSGKKSQKLEVLQSANLFFGCLGPEQLWQWMESLLSRTIAASAGGYVVTTLTTESHTVLQSLKREVGSESEGVGREGVGREGVGREGVGREGVGRGETSEDGGVGSSDSVHGSLPSSPVCPSSPDTVWGSRRGEGGLQLSCSSACKLIRFLLQVIPLETMEDVYVHHLPHLCWFTLHTLSSHDPLTVKPRSVHHSLELLLFCIQKMVQEAATSTGNSSTSPPARPIAQNGSTLASYTDKLKWKLLTQFSAFFTKFVNVRLPNVCNHGDKSGDHTHTVSAVTSSVVRGAGQRVSGSVERCFVSGCRLLCLLAHVTLSRSPFGGDKESVGAGWLQGMKTICTGSHDHHMTFTALETLLNLLAYNSSPAANRPSRDMQTAITVLCPDLSTIVKDTAFIEAVTQYLWSSLCPSLSVLHVEASCLLCWVHTLSRTHTCETTLLREFTSESIEVYQRFTVLWQHSPDHVHGAPSRPFNRALLRMVEGLQSRDSAVRGLVQAWVHSATTEGDLHSIIAPLIRIILDQNDKRKVYTGQPSDNGIVEKAGKYYYSPAGACDVQLTQDEEMKLVYSQVIDTDQVLYALSLLQAVLFVDPGTVIANLASSQVSVGTYGSGSTSHLASSDQLSGQKSLLELILISLTAFVRSEYPDTLEVTSSDVVENLRVKCTAIETMSFLTLQFSLLLSSGDGVDGATSTGGGRGLIHNPSYLSALVTLCDVQKVLLLSLSQVVGSLTKKYVPLARTGSDGRCVGNGVTPTVNSTKRVSGVVGVDREERTRADRAPSVPLRVLFVHLLRCLHNLISLETQCVPSSPAAMTPSSKFTKRSLSTVNQIQPGLSTASQPFFQSLVIDILANSSLSTLHPPLLHMFSATLPHLGSQVDDLAPKILRQLCRNLEASMLARKARSERESRENFRLAEAASDGMAVVTSVQALVDIIHCCLFGEYPPQRGTLRHNSLNRFWDASSLGRVDDSEEASSPTSKQPSAMSWLFGVFATASHSKTASSPVGAKLPKLGLSQSKIGHSILLLLPAVYNALTEVWTWHSNRVPPNTTAAIRGSNDRGISGVGMGGSWLESQKERAEFEDVKSLVLSLLGPLAAHEPVTFLSSISTVWLEWDLGSKVNPDSKKMSKRKDHFIVMLHHIQVLSLEQFIRSVQFSFTDLARGEDSESSVLRQKYLLHFFYKYISSPLQGWEELAECHSVMVLFLRDCYSQCYNGTSDSLLANCHLLCMLTSILHVYICRVPGLEKKQKKERKELQDLTHKLCEVLSSAAGCSPLPTPHNHPPPPSPPPPSPHHPRDHTRTDHGDFEVVEHSDLHTVHRKQNLVLPSESWSKTAAATKALSDSETAGEGKVGGVSASVPSSPGHALSEKRSHVTAEHVRSAIVPPAHLPPVATVTMRSQSQKRTVDSSTLPGAQALAVLANTVSHFIDGVFGSSEKEKILALLKVILHNVWPHLQNHSKETQKLYHHAVKLLSSLSGFQATRRAWRRETFDLFMANNFFIMELESLQEWKVLVDNMMTQDKTTFRDLLTKLAPALAPGISNIFTTAEHEALNTARVVKRMAFAILSAETDQYTSYLPDIQEKLSDCLKLQRHPLVTSEVFLSFRTLLLKFSSTHLLSFWPAIVAETLSTLQDLESDLNQELRDHRAVSANQLQLYLSVSKLLHTAWSLPSHFLPHFQFLQWGFSDVGSPHSISSVLGTGPIYRICTLAEAMTIHNPSQPPAVCLQKITSLRELAPFFTSLSSSDSVNSTLFRAHQFSSGDAGNSRTSGHQAMQISSVEKELLRDFLEPYF